MNVVVEIAGREALPVWTIPYVTSWRLSPDMLVRNLVGCDFGTAYPHYFFPTAFNLDEHGKPSPLSPAQWSGTHNLLGKLHQGLKDEKQRKDKERIEWEMQSIAILLIDETCYVWRDEFESYYERLIDCSKNKENIELQFNPKLPREYALKLKELHAEKTLEKPDMSSLKNSPVLPETMKSVALKAEDNMFNQPLSSHHELDPRIRFRHKFGETLSITELMQHWQSNVNFINEFAFAKKIRPNLDNREARVDIKNGKRIFSFISLPTDGQDCIVEDVDDCPQYTELPDNTYFYWTDILSYEEAHPEFKKPLELEREYAKNEQTKNTGNDSAVSKYDDYKTSLDKLKGRGIDLKVLSVKTIYIQVKQTDKTLWGITLATFRRDVWSRYSTENDLKKKPGRPRSK
ncbi:MAG: hypothetical protein Q8Q54_10655 [Methylococcales bacterium]|nr:hypothetical protein [Methylococcales bacterium]